MSDQDPTSRRGQGDDDSRRYFTDRPSAQAANRHRRRRGPGDPTTTGSIPIVRVEKSLPDPTIEYRTPDPSPGTSPYFEVRYRSSEEPRTQFTEPPRQPGPPAPPAQPVQPPRPSRSAPDAESHVQTGPIDRVRPAGHAVPFTTAGQEAADTAAAPDPQWEPEPAAARERAPERPAEPTFDVLESRPGEVGEYSRETPVYPPVDESDQEPDFLDSDYGDGDDGYGDGGYGDGPTVGGAMPARRRNKRVLLAVGAIALIVILVIAGLGLKWLGVFDSRTDYDSATGSGSVLVHVPEDAAIRDVGQTLADAGVVGSKRAFVDAAESGPGVAAGFYDMPKGISAKSAIDMMSGADRRVGRIIVPEGLQLDSKESTGGHTRPGIFEMIAGATTIKTDDAEYGVTVAQLEEAAAESSPDELGVPSWAREKVEELTGDHRRIEGLIASGAWEDIDPTLDAREILRELITRSETRYTAWGLLSGNDSGLSPYDTLTVASIVEGEARKEVDFPKVARVILNRLDRDQRLEMDSTANYTADVRANDLHGAAYNNDNEWNTYKHDGLPLTPIGAVGDRALHATENPADGKWLYFVTVDEDGTTLFAKTFDKHKQNRQVACRNKFLTVGCE
ncbi:endolytic transglycosylase MltG [Gordonia sp. HY002]|uniref:endolytic transglycosylase MltG n=1 Tax=Gordonia zhenghanii TaxID=2911516 RepID=UPI001EF10DBF|nr:endolytic transglycosylase MltG [Gordonia zhenghanii]MCF8569745.1 endolytic transglycosylase MltG [Gordonia zhenghanii]MCF8603221.1 endolytic transglycosylase MltG [Gordonia zhenghanii]